MPNQIGCVFHLLLITKESLFHPTKENTIPREVGQYFESSVTYLHVSVLS